MSLHNLALMNIATGGSGPITLAGAATVSGVPYLTFAQAGVVDGETIHYSINCINGSEVGSAVWTAATKTLTRTVVNSTNGNSPINVSNDALVSISPLASDINSADAITIGTTLVLGDTTNGLLYDNAGTVGNLATAVGGLLNTDGSGVPSVTTTPTLIGTLAISPTAASNTQALVITQSTPNSGSIAGPIFGNTITFTDQGQTVTDSSLDSYGQIKNQTTALRINHRVTGGSANHFGISIASNITGSNGGVSPLVAGTYTNAGPFSGNQWSIIGYANVGPSGNLTQSLVAMEAEVLVATGGVVKDRVALSLNSQGPTQATGGIDVATVVSLFNLGITNYMTAAPFGNYTYFSNNFYGANAQPIATTGSIFTSDTMTITNFVNFPTVTITGNILSFPNLKINGAGGMLLGGGSTAAPVNGLRVVVSPGSAGALQVGSTLSGTTIVNGAFNVDNSTASAVTGVYIFSDVAGNGAQILTTSSATNEALKLNAKGSGTIDLGGTSTGGVTVHGSFTATGLVTNADLVNSSLTINGSSVSLGGSVTVGAAPTGSAGGDLTGTYPNPTLAAVASAGTTGSSTAIPVITINAKGLTTSITTAAVIAPAGTLSGATLAAGVTASSLTSLGTITSLTATTINAFTLGGTISGGGNQLNNIIIGTSTPLAITGTTITGNTSISSPIHTASGALTFESNGTTLAGTITTAQKWGIGLETNPQALFVASSNSTTGIAVPSGTLAAFNGTNAASAFFTIQTFGAGVNPAVIMRSANGTAASPTASQSGDVLGFYAAGGYAASAYDASSFSGFYIGAGETHTLTANGTFLAFLTVPNTTTARAEAMRVFGSGGLGISTTSDPGNGLIYTNSASFFMRTKTSLTGGGTSNVPTLTTGPVTGNPTKWLPYDDNGTTRYVPGW